jgi:trehalose 6-phosphate phosphatase
MDVADLVAPLTAAPTRAAVLLDVDGTLAPIAPRPELARVPDETQVELRRLVGRYRLVACISGRPGTQAEALVGVEGIRYVGNHGLELHPDAAAATSAIRAFRERLDGAWPVEDKRLSLSFHFREAADEQAARVSLQDIAQAAARAGLDALWGRKVLEVRPRLAADKGTAVRTLVGEARVDSALYAGDDTTDLDAFRGLDEARLQHRIRVAVSSPEASNELLHTADLVVDGPAGVLGLLRRL